MNYTAEVKAFGDADKILECFEPEIEKKQNRSKLDITKKEDYVLFTIEAQDSVALRATLNGITKLLTVFEKAEQIKNG